MAKKKAKKKAHDSKKVQEPLVVASKVKNYIRSKKMMMSKDALCGLSCKVRCILDSAMARTKANKRSTVKPQDL